MSLIFFYPQFKKLTGAERLILKLATRRQVPYQIISRSELNNGGVAKFRAVVATELDPPSAAEHKVLQDFAENGGIVFALAASRAWVG